MADLPEYKCTVLSDGIALLESGDDLLYGVLAEDLGLVFVRIVTTNPETGEVEFRCSLKEDA